MAGTTDCEQAQLGLWAVLSLSAEYSRLRMEPQARLPDLLRTGTEPKDQAQEAT